MHRNVTYRKLSQSDEIELNYTGLSPLSLPLHHHAEYELIFFASGAGREFVGNATATYRVGDLTLIGPDRPHLHLCDTPDAVSHVEILYFPREVLPCRFDILPECRPIDRLLAASGQGVRFADPQVIAGVRRMMAETGEAHGIERLATLYRLLDLLAHDTAARTIAPSDTLPEEGDLSDTLRRWLHDHMTQPFDLGGLADRFGKSPAALCRYFKRHTGSTITGYLNRIRIAEACRRLAATDDLVSQIGYAVGYNNLTYFNRIFRIQTGMTPKAYRTALHSQPSGQSRKTDTTREKETADGTY